ncbi:dinucleotide-binding protein [Actinoplanes cyaneus]|uniref:Dinucleotide-binding protein n=1 Tax=Actinoplanes cyaneus TaxID=52696 RepID=A0A919ISR7_9ACTN|nr:hypothetical protein [Actinoplanes cyaneus]MCW2144067.1 hypothetical protein [Actinoplanes cyaneus]GID70758.1 dinucleotide-binding protein [Actinoplanes cyaneus]
MEIAIVGRGHLGSALSRFWLAAGHQVTALGREGGDASGADVLVVAVPAVSVARALRVVDGYRGAVTIDATNLQGPPPVDHLSLAHLVQSLVGGPVAKAFNTDYALLYDEIERQQTRPSHLYAADAAARPVAERLIRDVGFKPVFVGDLSHAPLLEQHLRLVRAIAANGYGPYFSWYGAPGELWT